jgi:pyruvate formate lyase activating enzyme
MCRLCANYCRIPEGGLGYCGLRKCVDGRLIQLVGRKAGVVQWYHDPLPTNCVADEVCPGGTGCGYPEFSHSEKGPETGYKNLAVFYGACSFNCLYCQNWHYRELTQKLKPLHSARELADAVDGSTSCICFFGGDPGPQSPHALSASRIARQESDGILRICWETNGYMARGPLKQAAKLSLESGGCIKFDLKAWNRDLHKALTGVDPEPTRENFRWLAGLVDKRPEVPFLMASTLMVPGYVDENEVREIANFIAGLNPSIPYRLLAFHPDFIMNDLPCTSDKEAAACEKAAKAAGLENVRIGNLHLLW